jgi:hypothetical protein
MSATFRPTVFTVAITLLWLALVSSLIRVIVDTNPPAMPVPLTLVYGLIAIVFLVKAFFIYKIYKTRNWARIVYLLMVAIGLIKVFPDLIPEVTRPTTLGLVDFSAVVLQIFSVCLLFTPDCNLLFKKTVKQV